MTFGSRVPSPSEVVVLTLESTARLWSTLAPLQVMPCALQPSTTMRIFTPGLKTKALLRQILGCYRGYTAALQRNAHADVVLVTHCHSLQWYHITTVCVESFAIIYSTISSYSLAVLVRRCKGTASIILSLEVQRQLSCSHLLIEYPCLFFTLFSVNDWRGHIISLEVVDHEARVNLFWWESRRPVKSSQCSCADCTDLYDNKISYVAIDPLVNTGVAGSSLRTHS